MVTTSAVLNLELIASGAATTASPVANIELIAAGAATTTSPVLNIELISGTATTFSPVINIELLKDLFQAGQSEVVMNLVGAQANRLRAELYDWQVRRRGQSRPIDPTIYDSFTIVKAQSYIDEFEGSNIGTGPILNISSFRWNWGLDTIGDWQITVPAMDPHLVPALDGSAQIIKIYLENVGHFFTGWITEHEFNEAGELTISGFDMGVFLSRRNSFYRHEYTGGFGSQAYRWAAAQLILATYELTFGEGSAGLPGVTTKRFQSQSVVEMFQELNLMSGNHWVINPVRGEVFVAGMGSDSGKIVTNLLEDDSKAIEEGVLVIDSLTYSKSDDEIVNSLLAQGSNNAFGVAVELRHTSQQNKSGAYSGIHWSQVSFHLYGRQDEILGDGVESDEKITSELGIGGSVRSHPTPHVLTAFAVPVGALDFAWAATFGFKQIYHFLGGIAINSLVLQIHSGLPSLGAAATVLAPMGNFTSLGDVPEVNDVVLNPNTNLVRPGDRPDIDSLGERLIPAKTDQVNFSEIIWFPNQRDGFTPISGGYAVVFLSADDTPSTFNPTIFGTGAESWVQAVKSNSGGKWWDHSAQAWIDGPTPYFEISGLSAGSTFPYMVLGQFAGGMDDTNPTSGRRIFYIRDNTSIDTYGLREKVVSFQNAVDSRQGVRDIVPSADVLYHSASTYLERHKDRFELISFSTIGALDLPTPGEKIRVAFRGQAEVAGGATEGVNRKFTYVDINALYWVLSIEIEITDEGIRHNFTVATVPENLLDPNAIPFEIKRAVNRHNNYMSEIEYGSGVGIVQQEF